jgi:NAD(P)-dependent dehydrogenase (short-subunit alcohol dehydrogenase family)
MKTLLITGGTGGLGSVVVERLKREYRCVLLYHSTVPEGVEGVWADLADAASVRAAVAQVEAPYGLVHLAGGWAGGKVSETSTETWGRMIGLNLTSAFTVIREALPRMARPGRIIAISSEAARKKIAASAAYTIAKTGLNTLIEMTAAEVAGSGITANALLPGTLDDVLRQRVADAILFLLSDAAAGINGSLIAVESRP